MPGAERRRSISSEHGGRWGAGDSPVQHGAPGRVEGGPLAVRGAVGIHLAQVPTVCRGRRVF